MRSIIHIDSLTKKYKKSNSIAVDQVCTDITPGEIVGVLGPNGAGKSTLIKMILGVIRPTSGEISVFDRDPMTFGRSEKNKLGVFLGGKSNLIYHLPVIDSARLFKSIYRVDNKRFKANLDYFAERLQCTDILKQRVATLSLGQRMRAELLCLFIYQPQLLILDEPTLGLDIEGKRQFRELLRNMADEQNTTVIITSHDVNDMQKLCHRIIVICEGQKKADIDSNEFDRLLDQHCVIETDASFSDLPEGVKFIDSSHTTQRYLVDSGQSAHFKQVIQTQPYTVLRQEIPSLEDLLYEYYR